MPRRRGSMIVPSLKCKILLCIRMRKSESMDGYLVDQCQDKVGHQHCNYCFSFQ